MPEMAEPNGRGAPFPDRLPHSFIRLPAQAEVAELVAWWWLCRWDLPNGQRSDQQVLAFPALNFTIDNREAAISGPTSKLTTRSLTGHGWVIGALLKPAATPIFTREPTALRDQCLPLDLPELYESVAELATQDRLANAIAHVSNWLAARSPSMNETMRRANHMAQLATTNRQIESVPQLAQAVGVSQSALYRLAATFVGVSPYNMIRRRRMQEVAERIRTQPQLPLAEVAADFGMTDQAHLAREFKTAFGATPVAYRNRVSDPAR